MQPLDLNLASNPFRNNTLLWVGYSSAAILLLVFSVWNVQAYREHRRLLGELRSEVGTFESQRRELETRATRAQNAIEKYDIDLLRVQSDKANEVINWKAFSWTRLFNSMEEVQPEQVRMNAIRPLFRSRQRGSAGFESDETSGMPVSIEGTARTYADFAEMERVLQSAEQFRRVWPERANRNDGGEVIFQLSFLYDGDDRLAEADSAVAADGIADEEGVEPDTISDEPIEVQEVWPAAEPDGEERGEAAS